MSIFKTGGDALCPHNGYAHSSTKSAHLKFDNRRNHAFGI